MYDKFHECYPTLVHFFQVKYDCVLVVLPKLGCLKKNQIGCFHVKNTENVIENIQNSHP